MNKFLIILLFLLAKNLFAQVTKEPTQYYPKNSVSLELFGAAVLPSINYYRIVKLNKKLYFNSGVGFSIAPPGANVYSFAVPFRVNLQYGNKKVNPIIGFSLTPFIKHLNFKSNRDKGFIVYAPNVGVELQLFDYIYLLPKYYAWYSNEQEWFSSNKGQLVHGFGLEFKYSFPRKKIKE